MNWDAFLPNISQKGKTVATILSELRENVFTITLNRPEKRNALNPQLVKELDEALAQAETNPQVKAVVITGAGKAFCAGADLAYLRQMQNYSDEENLQDSRELALLFHKIYQLPKLTVALVNGPALAGGCGLALCCDFIFAAEEYAKFGFTETRIGFIPAIVMNFLIRKTSPSQAFRLAVAAGIIDAPEAKTLGLITDCFPQNKLQERVNEFLQNLLVQNSFHAMIQTKALFQQLQDLPLSEGIQQAYRANAKSRRHPDCVKGLNAFLNKEKISWDKI